MPARILRATIALFAEASRGWSHRNPDLLSAALAYNTLFSLAPLLLLLVTIAGAQYRSQVIGQIIALIVLFGARLTHVYAERHGTPIAPGKNMMRK